MVYGKIQRENWELTMIWQTHCRFDVQTRWTLLDSKSIKLKGDMRLINIVTRTCPSLREQTSFPHIGHWQHLPTESHERRNSDSSRKTSGCSYARATVLTLGHFSSRPSAQLAAGGIKALPRTPRGLIAKVQRLHGLTPRGRLINIPSLFIVRL